MATAVTLPLVVIIALLLGNPSDTKNATTTPAPGSSSGPLPAISVSAPPDNPSAAGPCTKLLAVLPVDLDGLASRPALSTSPFVVAWGDPAIVLRCGVTRPKGLTPGSADIVPGIDGVFYWVDQQKKATVFTAIDRAAYVEVTVPKTYAGGPLAPVSEAIRKAMPAVCVVDGTADPASQCTHRS